MKNSLDRPGDVRLTRRALLKGVAAAPFVGRPRSGASAAMEKTPALIAITLDLEMSRHYPRRGMTEWDYQKGNLDEATKQYALDAAKIAREMDAVIHFFCVGRVLEQADISWLQQIAEMEHPIGNHTYDHVNLRASSPTETQFRFQRAPWLVKGRSTEEVIRENIRLTNVALADRAGITANGFRTPGGFADGLMPRDDLQQLLLSLGFDWVSSKYPRHQSGKIGEPPGRDVFADIVRAQSEAQPFRYASGLLEIPMSPISDVTAFRSYRWGRADFLQAVQLAVQWAIETGSVFDFLCHPSCMVVEDPDFQTIRLICELVRDAGNRASIVGLDTIAERYQRR